MQVDAGKKNIKHVDGVLTEDRAIWKEELQRHCEEVFEDVEETIEKQEDRIKEHKKNGDKHFTEEGGVAEITIDLVLSSVSVFVSVWYGYVPLIHT